MLYHNFIHDNFSEINKIHTVFISIINFLAYFKVACFKIYYTKCKYYNLYLQFIFKTKKLRKKYNV